MKIILIRTTAIFVLLFFIFFGWLTYRKHQSFQFPIHKDVDKVIRINVDAIYKTLAVDLITHPGNYIKQSKEQQGKKEPKTGMGFNLPANAFIYTIKGQGDDTFFGYLKISDSIVFKNFIKKRLGVDEFKEIEPGILHAFSKNKQFEMAFTGKEVAFACSPFNTPLNVSDLLIDILKRSDMLSSSSELFQRLKRADAHISFIDQDIAGSLNFLDGKVNFSADFGIDSIGIPEKIFHKKFAKESSIKGWLNADIKVWLKSDIVQLKHHNLNIGSLIKLSAGYIDFEMRKAITQIDTAITYTYDDNFEKIALKTIQEKQVPALYLTLKNHERRLVNYLQRQDVLDEKLVVNKDVFPLYHLYGFERQDYMQLSTVKNNLTTIELMPSAYFFNLEIDFNQLRKQQLFPVIHKHTVAIDSLIISAEKVNATAANLKGTIYFRNENINSLNQLINIFP